MHSTDEQKQKKESGIPVGWFLFWENRFVFS